MISVMAANGVFENNHVTRSDNSGCSSDSFVSCSPGDYKPIIYLYPQEETEVTVKLRPTPERNGFTVVEWGGNL